MQKDNARGIIAELVARFAEQIVRHIPKFIEEITWMEIKEKMGH